MYRWFPSKTRSILSTFFVICHDCHEWIIFYCLSQLICQIDFDCCCPLWLLNDKKGFLFQSYLCNTIYPTRPRLCIDIDITSECQWSEVFSKWSGYVMFSTISSLLSLLEERIDQSDHPFVADNNLLTLKGGLIVSLVWSFVTLSLDMCPVTRGREREWCSCQESLILLLLLKLSVPIDRAECWRRHEDGRLF